MNDLDYLHDVCPRCLAVISMPADGGPSSHLCIWEPVTVRLLTEKAGIAKNPAECLLTSIVMLGVAEMGLSESAGPLVNTVDDPRREGPFLPASPPPIITVGDLLLWTREDMRAVFGFGRASAQKLQLWLARHGYVFASRSDVEQAALDAYWTPPSFTATSSIGASLANGGSRLEGLPRVAIPANGSLRLLVMPSVALDVTNLYISPRCTMSLTLRSIRVERADGAPMRELLADDVPADLFSADEIIGGESMMDPIALPTGSTLVIDVVNVSRSEVVFEGALHVRAGREVARAPASQPPVGMFDFDLRGQGRSWP